MKNPRETIAYIAMAAIAVVFVFPPSSVVEAITAAVLTSAGAYLADRYYPY